MASDTSTPSDPPRDSSSRRDPPTIDLASSEFTSGAARDDAAAAPARRVWRERLDTLLDDTARPYLAAILCGLLAALSAVLLFWGSGLFGETQATIARLNDVQQRTSELSSQVNRVEAATKSNASASAAPVAALTSRVDALEKSIAAIRADLADAKRQNETLAASIKDLSATTRASNATDPQVLERLARLEGAVQGPTPVTAEPPQNAGLQRLMVATTLDTAVRRNEPFASALSAARKATDNPALLSPLDAFADKGVPTDAACLRDLRDILAQIKPAAAPKTAAPPPAGDGLLDRLQASLSRVIRIERDTAAASQPAPSTALEAALRNNDLASARRELAGSGYASQPQVQNWLQLMQARDTALAATRQFQADALSAVTKGQ